MPLSNAKIELLLQEQNRLLLTLASQGWSLFMITIMFNHIPGKEYRRKEIMSKEIEEWVYKKLGYLLVRNPGSNSGWATLPRAIIWPDHTPLDFINDGLHYQGLIAFFPLNRANVWPAELVANNHSLLCGKHGVVRRVRLDKVWYTPEHAAEYVGKSLLKRRTTFDDCLVFPPHSDTFRKKGKGCYSQVREAQKMRLLQNCTPHSSLA